MKVENTCSCCGKAVHQEGEISAWAVVTAQVADGHDRDVYFISNSKDEIRHFANAVNPKTIYSSYYPTLQEAIGFVDEFLDGYDEIDPVTCH